VLGRHTIGHNGWVFVSGFALHNAQFKGQMLMAKLAQIPCYRLPFYRELLINKVK
jgi:hypothetical protein